jgi:4-hydroxy-3-polyprenylbenzoate decarboxylase
VDAPRKLPGEGYRRDGGWPQECVVDPLTGQLVDRRWASYRIQHGADGGAG